LVIKKGDQIQKSGVIIILFQLIKSIPQQYVNKELLVFIISSIISEVDIWEDSLLKEFFTSISSLFKNIALSLQDKKVDFFQEISPIINNLFQLFITTITTTDSSDKVFIIYI